MNECIKCIAWNQASIENGYASGMCEECFNRDCVMVDLSYNHDEFKDD